MTVFLYYILIHSVTMTCYLFDFIKNREVINYTSSCIQYTVTDYSCICPPHDTVTRSSFKCHTCIILEIRSNTATTMCYFTQLGAMWRELYKQGFKCNLSQKSPCSYDWFSELGNGSQKVLCCDDWLLAGHWMLLNLAPDTLSYLLPQQLEPVHMRVDATMWYRNDNHCSL